MPGTTLGALIQARRADFRVSQATVAWIARVSRNTVSNIERNDVVDPDGRVVENLTAALGLDDWFNLDDDNEIADYYVADHGATVRLIQVMEAVRASDPDQARKMADLYVTFMKALRDARDDGRLSQQQALHEAIVDLARLVLPLLSSANEPDVAVVDLFMDLGWSPEDTPDVEIGDAASSEEEPARVPPPVSTLQPPASIKRSSPRPDAPQLELPGLEISRAEYEQIRQRSEMLRERLHRLEDDLEGANRDLHKAHAARDASQQQAAVLQSRLAEAERASLELHEARITRAIYQREVAELEARLLESEKMRAAADQERAELSRAMADILDEPVDAARQFRRLKPEVQDLIRHGEVMDTTVVYSPDVPGLAHMILTVKPEDFPEHIGIRKISSAAIRMDLAVDIAGKILNDVMPLEGVASAEDMRRAVDEVLNFFGFDVPGLSDEEG